MPDLDALLHSLHHVVHGQGGDTRRDERLHLDPGGSDDRSLRTDAQRRGGPIRRDRHDEVGQAERVAERNQVGRPLAAHHPGDLGHREHVPLRAAAVDDQAQRLLAADHLCLGDGSPGRAGLRRDVDHPRAPPTIDVGQPPAVRPGLRSLVHATSVPGAARTAATVMHGRATTGRRLLRPGGR